MAKKNAAWLYSKPFVRLAVVLAEQRGRFLFEILPQYFPHGRFTELEACVWAIHQDTKPKP